MNIIDKTKELFIKHEKGPIFIHKEDFDSIKKQYEENIINTIKNQIEYSSEKGDKYRFLDDKTKKRLVAKKIFSIRKLNIVPILHIDENFFLNITFGTVIYNNKIMYKIGEKPYTKSILSVIPVVYPDGFTENVYLCFENITYTISFKELNQISANKDIKIFIEHSLITVQNMNEEKMSFELTGFFNAGKNLAPIALLLLGTGGFIGLILGYLFGKFV